jgi:prepilin-type N-terminal cleavage/methylation domain-containing protein
MEKLQISKEKLVWSNWRARAGFTLIELLVVISVIGILAAVLLTNFVGVRQRGADSRIKSDFRSFKTALQLYFNDYQAYPGALNGTMLGCGVDGDAACSPLGVFSAGAGNEVLMGQLPENFDYYSDGADQFLLVAELSNASDEDIVTSQTKCDVSTRIFFTGTLLTNDYLVCEN